MYDKTEPADGGLGDIVLEAEEGAPHLPSYSVLMSVYAKETPAYLADSLKSIFEQTHPTDDFVLVCDGPLTPQLDAVIKRWQKLFKERMNVIRLKENGGLGKALALGLKECSHELVARMDSDDISLPDRMERELHIFREKPVDIVSGTILEFIGDPSNIVGERRLPETAVEITAFSRKRNPFNHPAVMFRKEKVIASGSYDETFHLFEDYYLWVRMLKNGCSGYNIPEPLLKMRTSEDFYMRRGGKAYARDLLAFERWKRSVGWTTAGDYVKGAIPHALVCVMPGGVRKMVYDHLHGRPEASVPETSEPDET